MTEMTWTNTRIAAVFAELGERLQLIDDKPFRALAYVRAAQTFRDLPQSIAAMSREGRLGDLDGIGPAIIGKVEDLLTTGTFDALEEARASVPDGLVVLNRLPGIGPATAKRIWRELDATTLDEVMSAAADGSLIDIPKVTAKTVGTILDNAESVQDALAADIAGDTAGATEYLRDAADNVVDAARSLIQGALTTVAIIPLGDLANGAETVNDLSALVWAPDQLEAKSRVDAALTAAGWVTGSDHRGATYIAPNGPVLHLSFPHTEDEKDSLIAAALEAVKGSLSEPDLVAELHCHSTWSDGRDSILSMARAAHVRGDSHMVITDHSAPYALVGGLDEAALREQAAEIAEANAILAQEGVDFRILQGSEVEILSDGELGLDDSVLEKLDWVVASIHVSQRQTADQLRDRMERVLSNPHVDCIGHPTSRILLTRPSTELDVEWLIQRASQTGTVLELNANPRRLDLSAHWCARAAALQVPIAINSDAHNVAGLNFRSHGVIVARRAGLSADQVVNCWSLARLLEWTAARASVVR